MPTIYYTILFWIYWAICLFFGGLLTYALFREKEPGTRALAAMLLVPVILRVLLVK